ncbi:hypothetical protein D3C76_926730 [compost metagenome]
MQGVGGCSLGSQCAAGDKGLRDKSVGLYAGGKAQFAGLADHGGIAAGIDLGVGPLMRLAQRHLLHPCLSREHRVPAKVGVFMAGLFEKRAVIEVRRR